MYDNDWTECVKNDWLRHDPDDGACYTINGTIQAIWNQTLASANKIKRTLPSEEYYEYVFNIDRGVGGGCRRGGGYCDPCLAVQSRFILCGL